jgi:hypothetical protein
VTACSHRLPGCSDHVCTATHMQWYYALARPSSSKPTYNGLSRTSADTASAHKCPHHSERYHSTCATAAALHAAAAVYITAHHRAVAAAAAQLASVSVRSTHSCVHWVSDHTSSVGETCSLYFSMCCRVHSVWVLVCQKFIGGADACATDHMLHTATCVHSVAVQSVIVP